ncbi:MAG TPA: hypothetical protein DCW68_03090 [Rhodospirillaceae bacterium]|nr:MAG: hypothetical protein A2018_06065 [Alphaproteobacteria bacterium GWF2_58_20]HAU29077.1 hypothetical protein [Rhodospirillaceae bacterium]
MNRGGRWALILPFCGFFLLGAMGIRMFGMLAVGRAAFAQQAEEKVKDKAKPEQVLPVEVMEPQDTQAAGVGGKLIKPARMSFSEGEIEALQKLSERRDELDLRSKALEEKESALVVTRMQLEKKAAELDVLKQKIETLLEGEQQKENGRISSLVKVYENMKPKDAARIFESLEPDILLSVVSRMKEAKLSPILAALPAAKAQEITTTLVLNPAD